MSFTSGQLLTAAELNALQSGSLPIGGGVLTGPVTAPNINVTDGTHPSSVPFSFPTVAAMRAFNAAGITGQAVAICAGYYAAGDGGGGEFDYILDVSKTTTGTTTQGTAVFFFTDTSKLVVGMGIVGTSIPSGSAVTTIVSIVPNVSVTVNQNVTADILAGATITFKPGAIDNAVFFNAPGGTFVRRLTGQEITLAQMGLKDDYIQPTPYLTTASTAVGNAVVTLNNTLSLAVGMWAHHPAFPFGTTISSLTATTVTLSAVADDGIGVVSGEYVCFNPVASDNTALWANAMNSLSLRLNGFTIVVPANSLYYFANVIASGAGNNIRGQTAIWAETLTAQIVVGNNRWHSGFVFKPGMYLRVGNFSKINDLIILRAGLPGSAPNLATLTRYIYQWSTENGVLQNQQAVTSGVSTAGGQPIVNLTSVVGITVGMSIDGANIPEAATITAVNTTTNTVTMNNNTAAAILPGSPLLVGTKGRTVGIWANQGQIEMENIYILGFNTGLMCTAGPYNLYRVHVNCPNGFDLSGNGDASWVRECDHGAQWMFGFSGSNQTFFAPKPDQITIATAGTGYEDTDLLLDAYGNLFEVTSVDGSGGVTGISTPVWQGGSLGRNITAPVLTRCLSSDPVGSFGYGGGQGTGCTLTEATVATTASSAIWPGTGFYVHDRFDEGTFHDCLSVGALRAMVLSNVWVKIINFATEARAASGQGLNSVGIWCWNSGGRMEIHYPYVAGYDSAIILGKQKAARALIKSNSSNVSSWIRLIGGWIQGGNDTNINLPGIAAAITILDHTQGLIDGAVISGFGPTLASGVISVGANVTDWKIFNCSLAVPTWSPAPAYITIDPTSEHHVQLHNNKGYRSESSNGFEIGTLGGYVNGPADRMQWPQQISFDPSSLTTADGSPTIPLTIQNRLGSTTLSSNLDLARGGSINNPGIVSSFKTSSTGTTIDTTTVTNLITSATVAAGGTSYGVGDALYDPIGGHWRVATVNTSGAVLTVTNSNPAAYVGSAPSNPVATTTNSNGGTDAAISLSVSGGAVSASVAAGGTKYSTGNVVLVIGASGTYVAQPGNSFPALQSINSAGIQATATLTVNASGVISAVTVTNGGSGYAGVAPAYQLVATPGSGCTLTLGAGTIPNILALNPSGDTISGKGSVEATTATSGFFMIPFCAGPPTGAPTNKAQGICMTYDTTNHKLWCYDNGTNTWRGIALT